MKYIRLCMFASGILFSTYSHAMDDIKAIILELDSNIAWLEAWAETSQDLDKLAQLCEERAQYEPDDNEKCEKLNEAQWYAQQAEKIEQEKVSKQKKKNRKRKITRLNKKIKELEDQPQKTIGQTIYISDLLAELYTKRAELAANEEDKCKYQARAQECNDMALQAAITQLNQRIRKLEDQLEKTIKTFDELAELYIDRAELADNKKEESIYLEQAQRCQNAAWVLNNIKLAKRKLEPLVDKDSAQDCDNRTYWAQVITENYDLLGTFDPSQQERYYQEKEAWEDYLALIQSQHPGSELLMSYQTTEATTYSSDDGEDVDVEDFEYCKHEKLADIAKEMCNLYEPTDYSYGFWQNRYTIHITNMRTYLQSFREEYSRSKSDILELQRYETLAHISNLVAQTYDESSPEYKRETRRAYAEKTQNLKHMYLEYLNANINNPSLWREGYEEMLEDIPVTCFTNDEHETLSAQEAIVCTTEKRENILNQHAETKEDTNTILDSCNRYLALANLSTQLAQTYPANSDAYIAAVLQAEVEKLLATKYAYLELFTDVENSDDWFETYQAMKNKNCIQLLTSSEETELYDQLDVLKRCEKEKQFKDIHTQIHSLAAIPSKNLTAFTELRDLYTQAVKLFPQTYSLEDDNNQTEFGRYTKHLGMLENKVAELTT